MNKRKEKLKVFEAFAGYGSQRMTLKNIGTPFEVVGIAKIEGDVICSYATIHTDYLDKLENINNFIPTCKEDLISYLESINTPLDCRTFENKARKMKMDRSKEVYLANKLSKNYGDINRIDPEKLPQR